MTRVLLELLPFIAGGKGETLQPGSRAWPPLRLLAGAFMLALCLPGHAGAVPCDPRPRALQDAISKIWRETPDRLGIAIRQVGCNWQVGERTEQMFPQQSVSKLWVAATLLDAADRDRINLDERITLTRRDLTVFNQTLRGAILEKGQVTFRLRQLLQISLSESDNISNARLLRRAGGPDAVRRYLARQGLDGIRFGPGEIAMQSAIAGVTWQNDYSLGRRFEEARAKIPHAVRERHLQAYLDDPVDGATPGALTAALVRLAEGRLLSPASTQHLLDVMLNSRSGPRRLKGGVPRGWKVYHKTGTGQSLGRRDTAYNDIALLEAPDGSRYAVAVLIGETTRPIAARMELMQTVSRSVVQFHESRLVTGRRVVRP